MWDKSTTYVEGMTYMSSFMQPGSLHYQTGHRGLLFTRSTKIPSIEPNAFQSSEIALARSAGRRPWSLWFDRVYSSMNLYTPLALLASYDMCHAEHHQSSFFCA